jgi:hypothetical protein
MRESVAANCCSAPRRARCYSIQRSHFARLGHRTVCASGSNCGDPLKISDLELLETHGRYDTEAGVNGQPQVNPLDLYEDLRASVYYDKPKGTRAVNYQAIYLRHHSEQGLDGLYAPIERDAAIVVKEDLRPFVIAKDALAGEAVGQDVSFKPALARWIFPDGHQRSGQCVVGFGRAISWSGGLPLIGWLHSDGSYAKRSCKDGIEFEPRRGLDCRQAGLPSAGHS